jgi:uncharacterized membrane protein (DUF373 family)
MSPFSTTSISHFITRVLIFSLTGILIYSTGEFIIIVIRTVINHHDMFDWRLTSVNKDNIFLSRLQGLISALLLLTIMLELIHSLTSYLKVGSTDYLKIIIEIALVAIVRHVLALDIEHATTDILLGTSALILVLGVLYLLMIGRISFKK